jgi:hypothetical protein
MRPQCKSEGVGRPYFDSAVVPSRFSSQSPGDRVENQWVRERPKPSATVLLEPRVRADAEDSRVARAPACAESRGVNLRRLLWLDGTHFPLKRFLSPHSRRTKGALLPQALLDALRNLSPLPSGIATRPAQCLAHCPCLSPAERGRSLYRCRSVFVGPCMPIRHAAGGRTNEGEQRAVSTPRAILAARRPPTVPHLAHHACPERRHAHVTRKKMVDVHDNLAPALVTAHRERPHAVLAQSLKRERAIMEKPRTWRG